MNFKNLFTLTLCGLLGLHVCAQTPIGTARNQAVGSTVTIEGTVTNGPELGPIRYITDPSGSLAAYGTGLNGLQKGDSVRISGQLKMYNNLLEIDPSTLDLTIASGRPLPSPVVFSGANLGNAFNELFEGVTVRLNGVNFITTTTGTPVTTFAGNTNYRINNDPNLIVRVNSASIGANGIVGKPSPTGNFDLVGIMSQFCSNPATGCTTGYQLLLRNYDDFILGEAPNINTKPTQTNISSTGFTVNYSTLNNGNTMIKYGTSPGTFQDSVSSPNQSTNHSIDLSGLNPATVYYIMAKSTNGNGSSVSSIIPMMTASLSTGKILAYFIQPVNNNYAFDNNPAKFLNRLSDDTLIAYINRAKQTLDIAIYNWNNTGLSNITNAVNAAFARGVNVRVIADGGSANVGLNTMNSNIKVQKSPIGNSPAGSFFGIMHNKFMIIDANSTDPNDPILWTGSTNWTDDMMNDDPNNIVIFQDQSIARAYQLEFEEMWGSSTLDPGAIYTTTSPNGVARFGNTKADNTPREFNIGGKRVTLHFSPTDGTNQGILNAIGGISQSFFMANFVLTRNDLAYALRDKYNQIGAGNCSAAILDDTSNSGGTPYSIMKTALGDRLILKNNSTIFHHKYLIGDQNQGTTDPFVLTGSHNWSNAGDQRNDENTVIIHDAAITNQFYQEFAARMLQYSQLTPCYVTANRPLVSQSTLMGWYESEGGQFIIRNKGAFTPEEATALEIFSMDGRKIAEPRLIKTENAWFASLSTLNTGCYVVRVKTSEGFFATRMIK